MEHFLPFSNALERIAKMMGAVDRVADVVAREMATWAFGTGSVERAVFGTDDPEVIADMVASTCVEALGAPPVAGRFYLASAGCALGVRLETGADVVVKAHQTRWTASFLRAVQSGQAREAAAGIPCARPFAGPLPLPGRSNLAIIETWLPDPGMEAPQSRAARRVSARGLADQIRACGSASELPELARHPMRASEGGLYPAPHSPLFDFEATSEGAGWIDELAQAASRQKAVMVSPDVVAHTDWSARNVRLDDDRLSAVYDWDSLAVVPEMTALGQAAMTWSVTSEPGGSEFPTLADVAGYCRDYEEARGHELSPAEWRGAGAAACWALAYTARCEHALDARRWARPDQCGARDRLAEAGSALLALSPP